MRSSRTFRHGGIRVESGLDWEQRGSARNAFLPNGAVILLKQHAGKQARCVVRRGEYVREGMVIGRADGAFSSQIHSSIPGIVREVRMISLPEGGQSEAVMVALEGSFDRLGRKGERYLWKSMGRTEIISTLRDRGVVDTEAPGMPIHDVLSERFQVGLLIVNAVESEPYLRAEECLLRDKGAEVISILKKVLEPKKTFITTSQATTIVLPPSKDERVDVELVSFEARYPQDMPGQLLEALDGSRKRPMADAIIIKPSTAFAVYEAIVIAKPMVERYVSVSGGAIKRPAVLKTRIGTTIGDLIEECGGFLDPPARLVIGSTLRGHSVYNLDVPITKTTSAVIALNAEEIGSQLRSPCIRCGRCIEVCPERLDPSLLFRLIERGMQSRAAELGLGACTVCGACGYICPSRMPLVAAFSSEPQITTKLAWTQLRGENPH